MLLEDKKYQNLAEANLNQAINSSNIMIHSKALTEIKTRSKIKSKADFESDFEPDFEPDFESDLNTDLDADLVPIILNNQDA
jgi:hypothetical protein